MNINFIRLYLYILFVVLCGFTNNSAYAFEELLNSSSPIEITSDTVKYKAALNKIFFDGKVIAVQKDLKLSCDLMEVLFEKTTNDEGANVNKLKTIFLFGNVEILTPKENAYADKGIYHVSEEKLILQENVRLKQGDNLLLGDELIYLKNTGESILKTSSPGKRVRGTFTTNNIK